MGNKKQQKVQADRRFKKVQKAVEEILQPLYALSRSVLEEIHKALDDFKKTNNIPPKDPVAVEVADKIVASVFQLRYGKINRTSFEIGRDVTRVFGLNIAIEAWIFARNHILKNGTQLQGVPIIWRGVEEYFEKFLPPGKLAKIAEEQSRESAVLPPEEFKGDEEESTSV
jgi:hypothetical protein